MTKQQVNNRCRVTHVDLTLHVTLQGTVISIMTKYVPKEDKDDVDVSGPLKHLQKIVDALSARLSAA